MAKRFTDTDKWKKAFIRGLKSRYKLLWFYVCDDCDHAGIWQVDINVAILRIGERVTTDGAVEAFGDKIILIDNGQKWFIPSFIEFQYPSGLNEANNAHAGIIKALKKYNLIDANKALISPSQGAMDKDKDKDNTIARKIKHLEITIDELDKLSQAGYTDEQIENIFNAIANYSKIKNYTSLYLTSLKWLKKEHPGVTAKSSAKTRPIFSIDEPLPTRQVKPAF